MYILCPYPYNRRFEIFVRRSIRAIYFNIQLLSRFFLRSGGKDVGGLERTIEKALQLQLRNNTEKALVMKSSVSFMVVLCHS